MATIPTAREISDRFSLPIEAAREAEDAIDYYASSVDGEIVECSVTYALHEDLTCDTSGDSFIVRPATDTDMAADTAAMAESRAIRRRAIEDGSRKMNQFASNRLRTVNEQYDE